MERELASAPPSESVERQWGGYMAAYDERRQEYVAGYGEHALPQRFNPAVASASRPYAMEMESAPPSGPAELDWGGYMAAYDARLQDHVGAQPSAPPASDSVTAYSQAVVVHDRQ
jgi:hypothetical protein